MDKTKNEELFLLDYQGAQENEKATRERVIEYAKNRLKANPEVAANYVSVDNIEKIDTLIDSLEISLEESIKVIESFGEIVSSLSEDKVKYRVIDNGDEITVLLEDGGIAEIREVGEMIQGDGRQSVTEYYQSKFTGKDLASEESVWEKLSLGDMYYNNWKTPYNDQTHIEDALNWLSMGSKFEVDESIWPQFEESEGITKAIPSKLSEDQAETGDIPSPSAP